MEVLFLSRITRSAVPWKLVLKYFWFSLAFEYCPLFPLHMKKLPPLVQSLWLGRGHTRCFPSRHILLSYG